MPTCLRLGPFRFFFYSSDGGEPPHIHVERDQAATKFWLDPVSLQWNRGFSRSDIREVRRLIDENLDALLRCWNDFFGN